MADNILRIFGNVEIRRTFVNEKEKGTGSQMDWRIRKNDMLLRMLKVWSSVFCPEKNNM